MEKKSDLLKLAGAIALYFVLWFLIPRLFFVRLLVRALLHDSKHPSFVAMATALVIIAIPTVVFMGSQFLVVYFYAKLKMRAIPLAAGIILCLGAVLALVGVIVFQFHVTAKLGHYPNLREQLTILGTYMGPIKAPITLLIMLASANLGALVSLRVKDQNLLLPVVMFAAFIDAWTVNFGPVSSALKQAPDVVSAVSAPIPHVGTGAFSPSTMIGPGDFIFMALVFSAAHRLGLNGKRNFVCVYVAMTLGMLAVMFNLLPFLPALTVLAVGVVVANWKEFKLSKEEKISTAIVGVLLAGSLPLIWHFLSRK